MSNSNGSPNSTVGNTHSPRPIGAVTPNASPSGRDRRSVGQGLAKKPATVKRAPAGKKSKR